MDKYKLSIEELNFEMFIIKCNGEETICHVAAKSGNTGVLD